MKNDEADCGSGTLAMLAMILRQAAEDVGNGLRLGYLLPDLTAPTPMPHGGERPVKPREALEAAQFLQSPASHELCALVNCIVGGEMIDPDFLIRRARRFADDSRAFSPDLSLRRQREKHGSTSMRAMLQAS